MTQLSDQVLPEGARVGLYEIKRVLHQGDEAITYRAWSHHVNASIILKEYFPKHSAKRNPDGNTVIAANDSEQANFNNGLAGFLELSETLTDLDHPLIVQTLNSLEFNGTAYLIMDDVESKTLSQHLQSGHNFTDREFFKLAFPLLDAIQYLHDQGVVHGDINVDNIFLDDEGAPQLTGFAIATVAELYNPELKATSASDLYQAAETFYQCLSQIKPASLADRLAAVQRKHPDPLEPLASMIELYLSTSLLKGVDAMLSLDEKQRPKSAGSAAQLLRSGMNEEETEIADTLFPPESAAEPATAEDNPMIWLIIVGGVALLVVLGFFLLPDDSIDPEPLETTATAPVAETEPQAIAPASKIAAQPATSAIETTVAATTTSTADVPVKAMTATPNTDTEIEQPAVPVRSQALEILEQEEVVTSQTDSQQTPPAVTIDPAPEAINADNNITEPVITPTTLAPPAARKQTQSPEPPESSDAKTQIPTSINADEQTLTNWAKGKNLPLPERIQWHLTEAKKNFDAAQLTTPLENNAYQHYRIVLVLDPDNRQAKSGMNQIIRYYAILIERALDENRFNRARIYLHRARAVRKNSRTLAKLTRRLEQAEANQ